MVLNFQFKIRESAVIFSIHKSIKFKFANAKYFLKPLKFKNHHLQFGYFASNFVKCELL